MADTNSGLGWSAAQWETVNNAVTEAFDKASVASALLPCYGPLSASAENVRRERLDSIGDFGSSLRIDDDETLKLFNLTVNVTLSSEQVADESLSSARVVFQRAANTLAQVEDDVVFNGFDVELKDQMQLALWVLQSQVTIPAASLATVEGRFTTGKLAEATKKSKTVARAASATAASETLERLLRALRTQSVVRSAEPRSVGVAAEPNSAADFLGIAGGANMVVRRPNLFSLGGGGGPIAPTGQAW